MDPIEAVKAKYADQVLGTGTHAGQPWIDVKRDRIVDILKTLRDDVGLDMLTDLTAVDHLNQGLPERFAVVYQFYSVKDNVRARVKAWVPEADPTIDSASALYRSAPWAEREVWDLYGIKFNGHPDLKRLMLPENYEGHPLRKDYPLTGRGERMNFPRYVP
ncbi:MAG TPA: NADH-quinone oxidoreductase subunit C [Planctomycetota bacterium]|nr:NADH-quinone oxidoreductase subunit C [Planctomycetota bacterium]